MMVVIVVIQMLIRITALIANALTQMQVEIFQVHQDHHQDHVMVHVKMRVIKKMDIVMMETTIVDVIMMVVIVVIQMLIRITALIANALTQMQVEIAQVHQQDLVTVHVKMKVIKKDGYCDDGNNNCGCDFD